MRVVARSGRPHDRCATHSVPEDLGQHVVARLSERSVLLYIDAHLVNEITSPQAFEGLRLTRRMVRAPHRAIAVADHNVPTEGRAGGARSSTIGLGPSCFPVGRRRIDK